MVMHVDEDLYTSFDPSFSLDRITHDTITAASTRLPAFYRFYFLA